MSKCVQVLMYFSARIHLCSLFSQLPFFSNFFIKKTSPRLADQRPVLRHSPCERLAKSIEYLMTQLVFIAN